MGASKLMMRLVTLLAVVDMGGSNDVVEGDSSIDEICCPEVNAAALFFPKLSFHLEGFLTTGEGEVAGTDRGVGWRRLLLLREAISNGGEGKGYIDIGSNGSRPRCEEDVEILETDLWAEEDLDALLISRAKD